MKAPKDLAEEAFQHALSEAWIATLERVIEVLNDVPRQKHEIEHLADLPYPTVSAAIEDLHRQDRAKYVHSLGGVRKNGWIRGANA